MSPRFKHRVVFSVLKTFEQLFRTLPFDAASAVGGVLAQTVMPFSKKHTIANAQLKAFFPEMGDKQRASTLKHMWNNIGRTAAEFLSLPNDELIKRVHIMHPENLAKKGTPAIYLTAHMGNWELLPSIIYAHGTPAVLVHRQATNPLSAELIDAKRMHTAHSLAPKTTQGIAQMVRALKDGRTVGMLTDLRMSNGVPTSFLGVDAFTSNLPGELAVKYGAKIIPAHITRTHGAHFEATLYPEIRWDPTGNPNADVATITQAINAHYEAWIRNAPQQWIWFHERWGKKRFS